MAENEKRQIKIKHDKQAKYIHFPKNFEDLLNSCKSFVHNNDQNKIYQLIDIKNKKEIKTQGDFEEFDLDNYTAGKSVIQINLVDKTVLKNSQNNKLELEESSNLNFISHNFVPSDEIHTEKEINIKSKEDEDEVKANLRSLISEKMQSMEKDIINEVCRKVQNSIISNKTNNKKYNKVKHQNIKCNNCGMNNIIGVRYKCTQCENYNLCENCESKDCHDMNHILIKIKTPINDENKLSEKINKNLIYIKNGFDYSVEQKNFNFRKGDLILTQTVTLKNCGSENWNKDFLFKCIKNKYLNGNDVPLGKNVKSGESVSLDLMFDKVSQEAKDEQNEYVICYKLIGDNNQQIGNAVEFKVNFEAK